MKTFAEWIASLYEQQGQSGSIAGIRPRTIYPPGRSPFRMDEPRAANPLFQLGADYAAAPGSIIHQQASPTMGSSGGGQDPSPIIRAWDALKKKGKINDNNELETFGHYPDHKDDIPIAKFCDDRQDTIEMLSHEGFRRPDDMLRRICGRGGEDRDRDDYEYTPVDEEWLAIEIIKRRIIEHELRPKGYVDWVDWRSPKVIGPRRFETGHDDYRIEMQVNWPIHEDMVDKAKREIDKR